MRFADYYAAAITVMIVAGSGTAARAQTSDLTQPSAQIVVPSTSSSFNQQGFNLPTATRATGQDVVRGAGGISCHSAVGSGGPTLDMGVIGTNDIYSRDSAAIYGRVTIPLGKRPKRVDCTRLFELEVSRLQMELEMMRAVQQVQAREAAQPVQYADAEPPQNFSLGAIAAPEHDMGANIGPEPRPMGFVLGAPQTTPSATKTQPQSLTMVDTRHPLSRGVSASPDPVPTPEPVVLNDAQRPDTAPRGITVQIAAYRDLDSAQSGASQFRHRVALPNTAQFLTAEKVVKGRRFHTVQVTGLSSSEADALCRTLDGHCLRL